MAVSTSAPAGLTARSLYGILQRLTGAGLIGVRDEAGYFTGNTVEEALAELAAGLGLTDVAAAASTLLTIATGAVTATQTYHTIDTEAAAASDDLDTINGLANGQFYVFKIAAAARNVVFKHGTGNIYNPSGRDITLDVLNDKIFGFSDGTSLFVLDMSLATPSGGGLASALASASASQGASLIGVQDVGTYFATDNVEAALAQLGKNSSSNTVADPGTAQAIPVTKSGYVPLSVGAGVETNTLAIPTFIGQTLSIFAHEVLGGSRAITSAQSINQANNTIMTFAQPRDFIKLAGISTAAGLRWQVVSNDGVALS